MAPTRTAIVAFYLVCLLQQIGASTIECYSCFKDCVKLNSTEPVCRQKCHSLCGKLPSHTEPNDVSYLLHQVAKTKKELLATPNCCCMWLCASCTPCRVDELVEKYKQGDKSISNLVQDYMALSNKLCCSMCPEKSGDMRCAQECV